MVLIAVVFYIVELSSLLSLLRPLPCQDHMPANAPHEHRYKTPELKKVVHAQRHISIRRRRCKSTERHHAAGRAARSERARFIGWKSELSTTRRRPTLATSAARASSSALLRVSHEKALPLLLRALLVRLRERPLEDVEFDMTDVRAPCTRAAGGSAGISGTSAQPATEPAAVLGVRME
jgi:hypothetical protein